MLNYDKALRHIESCYVFGDYTDDALSQDKNLMQECLADHAHSVSFYSGIFAAANAYKNGMSIDELKKYLILEPFDSEFIEYKYLNTDGKYDYYVNIYDRIYIAIAKNAWRGNEFLPLLESQKIHHR